MSKGFFPYEYITDLKMLEETSLPPHEKFHSSLTNSNISDDEYSYCQRIWRDNDMKSLVDFLVWYNNLDVQPFLEAIEKQYEIYGEKHIDMFKDAISIPGIAVQWKFHCLRGEEIDIPLITRVNEDLHKKTKRNVVGGPAIIYNRHQEEDVTFLRPHDYGADAKVCKRVVGYDANALYLDSMTQPLPTGTPIRRKRVKKIHAARL